MEISSNTSFELVRSDSRQRESKELSHSAHHVDAEHESQMHGDKVAQDNIFHMHERRRAADRETMLAYRSSERTTLKIETQEGDKVRLKIRASESMSVSNTRSDDDGQEVASMQLQARSSVRVSFRVEGELNEAETAAIQSVIQQAGSLAESFYAGGMDEAFGIASGLDIDAGQLARVSIKLREETEGTYSQQSAALARPSVDRTDDDTDGTGTSGPVAGPDTGSTAAAASGTGTDVAATPPAAEDVTASDAGDPATAPVSVSASALQSIGQFLNGLLDSFGGGEQVSNTNLKLQVFSSLLVTISEQETDPDAEDAAALAGETVGVLGEQQTPLDAVA